MSRMSKRWIIAWLTLETERGVSASDLPKPNTESTASPGWLPSSPRTTTSSRTFP